VAVEVLHCLCPTPGAMTHPLNIENEVNFDQNSYTQKVDKLAAHCMEKTQSALQTLVGASFAKKTSKLL
jgi:hypothetical protein